jgi:ribosomal protein S18 acetylase RimI-like enzyme
MVSAKDFFSKIDLSKLDTATATQIREEILTLSPEDWDLIDNDSEMQKQMEIIKTRIENEFPTALGLKSNEENASESIKKVNETNLEKSKEKAAEVEKAKEALRKEEEEFESQKAKFVNDIEEMQMLIELTQDTLKENPNDEDLPMYLELLNDTLQGIISGQKDLLSKKKVNKTAFANGGELVINDTDIASDNEITALLERIEKDWGKESDYYSTIEGVLVGYSKSDADNDMYLNAKGIKRINEELANFDFQYRLTSNGIVDVEQLEEDKSNLYVYRFNEERGEVKASVEDMTTGITVWEYNYPDYSLDEEEREFQSSIVEDGFMKHFEDVKGLEKYLKSIDILPVDAELISAEDAIQDYEYYANGGGVNSGRSWYLDRQRYNTNESWEKPLRKRKRKYKSGGSVVDSDIIYVYKQIEKEKQRILSGLTVPYKEAFGDININTDDVFIENGSDELKYENVGYGGIRFMGNINGKVPTQGLYYKDLETKKKIENTIKALDQNNEDKRNIVDDIIKYKGKPKEQLAVLNMIAKRFQNGGLADIKKYEYRVIFSYKSKDGVFTESFQDKDKAKAFYDEKIKEDDIELVMFDYNEYNKLGYVSDHKHFAAFSWKDKKFENGGAVDEIKVGDTVNLLEIKMPNGEIQYERVENGVVKYIGEGIYGVENPKTRRIHQVRKDQIEGYENNVGVDYEKHYSSFPINEQSFGKLKNILNNAGFSHYKNTPDNQFKHGNNETIAIIGKTSVILTDYYPNTKRFKDSYTFNTEVELAKHLDKNMYYEDGGNIYPIDDARKPSLNSGVILLVKDTKEEADKYIVGIPDLFVAPIGDKWAVKKLEDGGSIEEFNPRDNFVNLKYIENGKELGHLNYEYDKNEVFSIDLDKSPYNFNSELYIDFIEVDKNARDKGIAKKLLKRAISDAKKLGIDVVTLKRDSGLGCNFGSDYDNYLKSLYASVGFIETWEQKDFDESGGEKNICAMHLDVNEQKFEDGGSVIELSPEQNKQIEAIYEKYHNIDYWGYKDSLNSQLGSWRNAYARGDKGALKYTEQDIIDNMWKREKMDFDTIVNSVRDMVSKKDLAKMISRLRYDQKVSLEIYEVLTGEKIKGMSNKQLSEYFTSKYSS